MRAARSRRLAGDGVITRRSGFVPLSLQVQEAQVGFRMSIRSGFSRAGRRAS